MSSHVPVMLDAVLRALAPARGSRIVDGTLGLGGHAEALLGAIGPEGRLIGIDRDAEMLARAEQRLAPFGGAFQGVRARISYIADVVRGLECEPVDGILLDLGICSAQIDDDARGMSFRESAAGAPLDMRMDRGHGATAAELLQRLGESELAERLHAGGVPAANRIARALCARRPLRTVGELLEVLRPLRLPRRHHHPATLVFQALRVAVNEELDELDAALEAAVEILAPGGRLVVLSYHSGEDQRVKAFFRREVRGCICPPDMPACGCGRVPRLRSRPAAAPLPNEVASNPRARSARLRTGERL